MGLTSVGEEERAPACARGGRRERSNSSGVKLLRWKIALTVMMLLFRVARVTPSFTSATPAGAARLPDLCKAAHCWCQSTQGFSPALGEAGHPGVGRQSSPGGGGQQVGGHPWGCQDPGHRSPELLIPATGVWIGTQSHTVGGHGELAFREHLHGPGPVPGAEYACAPVTLSATLPGEGTEAWREAADCSGSTRGKWSQSLSPIS